MPLGTRINGWVCLIFVSVSLIFMMPTTVDAKVKRLRGLRLIAGKSLIIETTDEVKRVSVGAPEVADILVLGTKQIYVTGKAVGVTNVIIWHDEDKYSAYELEVVFDTARLKRQLHQVLPKERDIRVLPSQNSITLTGTVSNTAAQAEALAIAKSFLPEGGDIVNVLQVAGAQQVMLEVKIAEMSKSLINRLGINFAWTNAAGEFAVGMIGGLTGIDASGGGMNLNYSPQVNALVRFNSGSDQWTGIFDILKSNGMIKILAEPILIAVSGQSAEFLAGGEFPVPVPGRDGNIGIVYKDFGVSLVFTPTVIDKDRISIKVRPEVSEVDYSVGTTIAGAAVPGLTSRRAATTVELGDGQSFAIAGLLKDTARETAAKYPILGDIPILGALFKSKSYQRNESELIIIVTPHLAKPLDMSKQTLPTDYYIPPDDAEFFLWGIWGKPSGARGRFDGDFGHVYTE